MTDLCLYELEDNVWDEFSKIDDHIFPHPSHRYENHFGLQGHGYRKSRVNDYASNTDESQRLVTQRKEEFFLPNAIKLDKMLEKDSCCHSPEAVLHTSCYNNSVKEVTHMASEETRMLSCCFERGNIVSGANDLSAGDPVTDDKCTGGDDSTYHYPLSDISQTDNDLGFLDNGRDEKEGSDLLYYEWPDDIGNFEDVDRMFRSCDSTFGLGSLINEDDFCLFSSSHSAEASDDAVKLGSKLSSSDSSPLNNASEHSEASRLNSSSALIDDSQKKNLVVDGVSTKISGAIDHSALGHFSYLNGSNLKIVRKVDLVPNGQANWQKKQARHESQLEGRRRDLNLQNGGSFQHDGHLEQFADVKNSFGGLSRQVFPISGVQQRVENTGANSFLYMESHTPFVQMEYNISDQISVSATQTSAKSENDVHPSSAKESSYASNLAQSMESTHGPAVRINEKIEKLCHSQDLQPSFARNFKNGNTGSPTFYNPVQKQALQSEYDIESHSEIEGVNIGTPAELDSSTAQDSSCISSVLDEISLEAASFRQLQQVMEQLDLRTKLCIRDSLYRLARSAEQRHNCEDTNVAKRDDRNVNGALTTEEANKGSGFMDMETNTNPIDRSVAHLLFHRSSETSTHLYSDAPSLKSPDMIHGSITSPGSIATDKICLEEAVATDKKLTSDS